MSALRNPANDLEDVSPFIRLGVAARGSLQSISEACEKAEAAKRDFVRDDIPAMAAVEGWRDFPADTMREIVR